MTTEVDFLELTETEILSEKEVVRYGWGNSKLKTWFITKTKKEFLPAGCIMLFTIYGKITDETVKTTDTYPKVGDVISDVNGLKIIVNRIN